MTVEQIANSTLRKLRRRFIPLFFTCFVVAWLDRVNVGFAALTMSKEIGLSSAAFGFGAGIFFLSYVALEIPANAMLERFGARYWFAAVMSALGIASGAMMFVHDETSFYVVRLLIGAAEAGLAPGIFFYLSRWVPAVSLGSMIGGFLLAMPVASVIGSPISGMIMQLHGVAGLSGWRWVFLLEAIPALMLAPITLRMVSDDPRKASWLTSAEQDWLSRRLASDASHVPSQELGILQTVRLPIVLLLAVAYFGVVGLNYAYSIFLPQIVQHFGLSILQTSFVTAIPFSIAAVGMAWWSHQSDRLDERRFHLFLPLALAVSGLVVSTIAGPPTLKLAFLCVAAFGIFAAIPVFWTLPRAMVPASALAAGIATVNSIGSLSGFVDSYAVGLIKDLTGEFAGGLWFIAGFGVISIVVLAAVTRDTAWARRGGVFAAGPKTRGFSALGQGNEPREESI
jgi:MFS transporter, ACS family, tartrate transporter